MSIEKILLDDHLVKAFMEMAKLKQKPVTIQELVPHVPRTGKPLTPFKLIDAADQIGFNAKLKKKKIKHIFAPHLPLILLLKDGRTCILMSLHRKSHTAFVKFSDSLDQEQEIMIDELECLYAGYSLSFRVRYAFEKRCDEQNASTEKKSWFWGTIFEFKSFYYHVLLAAFFINVFGIVSSLFIMNVYDRVVPNSAFVTLWTLAIGVLIVYIFDFLLKTLRALFVDIASKKVDILLSSKLLRKALCIKMEHQPMSTGVQASHLKEFETVREFFSSVTVAGLVDIPFVFIFLIVIGLVGGPLFIVPLLLSMVALLSAALLSRSIFKYIAQTFMGSAQKTAILYESLSAVEAIKTTSAYQSIVNRWHLFTTKISNAALKSKFYSTLASNITTFCTMLCSVIIVIWGVYRISEGLMTTGGLIASVMLSSRAIAPFAQLTGLLTRLQQTRMSMGTLNQLMATPEDHPEDKDYLNIENLENSIEFSRVSFHYPGKEINFLNNINLKVEKGEHIALIGSSGSGKTTLLKLMAGLYESTDGEVLMGGYHQQQINPELIRKHTGYLEQAPKLMFGNAASNIMMKAPWAKAEDVLKAAKVSGADDFLRRSEEGYQMIVGESGKGLSGGQIQMIAIARALLMDPTLLLLDEPTSSMDQTTESSFVARMKKFSKDCTLVISTHKRNILSLVDRVVVLDSGKIILDGPRDEVLSKLTAMNNDSGAKENE